MPPVVTVVVLPASSVAVRLNVTILPPASSPDASSTSTSNSSLNVERALALNNSASIESLSLIIVIDSS